MTTQPKPAWHQLINRIIRSREEDRSFRSHVSRGLVNTTEHYAYPHVLPYTEKKWQERPLLRSAAITASHTKLPLVSQEESLPLGKTFAQMSFLRAIDSGVRIAADQPFPDPSMSDVFSRRVSTLSQLPLEEAALAIDRLLTIGEALDRPIPVDYFRLTRLLLSWGNGISPESLAARRSVQRDFYSGAFSRPDREASTESD